MNFNGLIHPVAEMFPMMTDEELNDLAADIKANGLIHPIVLDKDGQLVDGRNRLEGCKRANVPATFRELPEGQDPVAFILSANVTRRHLNKGQQAMAVAKARCLLKRQSIRGAADSAGISRGQIGYASIVLEYASELADTVLAGATSLNDAYEVAQQRKTKKKQQDDEATAAAAKAEAEARERQKKLDRLQCEAPDIAALVQEDRLPLEEAMAVFEERRRKEREYAQMKTESLDLVLSRLDPRGMGVEAWAEDFLKAETELRGRSIDISPERAEQAAAVLLRYAELKRSAGDA